MSLALLCLALGLVVGASSTLLGIGGGVFAVPMLTAFAGLTTFQAVATSLCTVFLVTLINTLEFTRRGLVRWPIGVLLGIPSAIVAVMAGAWAVEAGEYFVQLFFLCVLMALAVITFLRRHVLVDEPQESPRLIQKMLAAGAGAFGGFVSAFTGIGAGIIMSPTLINLRLVRAKELVPTTNLSTMMTTAAATTGYVLMETTTTKFIQWPAALGVFAVATVTSLFLRPVQHKIPGPVKAILLSAVLLLLVVEQASRLFW